MNFPVRISSSRAAATMRRSKYMTSLDLRNELLGLTTPAPPADPYDANHPHNRGKDLEPGVIKAAARMMSRWLIDRGESDALPLEVITYTSDQGREHELEWIHPVHPMSAHPDFALIDAWGRYWLMDAKTSAIWQDYDPESADVPDDVFCQIHHLWECARACTPEFTDLQPFVGIPLFRFGRRFDPFVFIMIPIDPARVEKLIAAEMSFLETYVHPELRGEFCPLPDPESLADIVAMHPTRVPFKEHLADDDLLDAIWRLKAIKEGMIVYTDPQSGAEIRISQSDADKLEKALKLQILATTGDAECVVTTIPNGPAICKTGMTTREMPAQPARTDKFPSVDFRVGKYNKEKEKAANTK